MQWLRSFTKPAPSGGRTTNSIAYGAACVTAIAAGLAENASSTHVPQEIQQEEVDNSGADSCACCCEQKPSGKARWRGSMRWAFVDLFDDIFRWIFLGVVVAAAIQTWVSPQAIQSLLGGPFQSMLLMLVIGVPLYICAEASTPVAAVMIAQGLNPGAALVLLLVGPATNIGSLGVLNRLLGRRSIIIYLVTIVVVALSMGCLLNLILAESFEVLAVQTMAEPLLPTWAKSAGAVAFLGMGTASVVRSGRRFVGRRGVGKPA